MPELHEPNLTSITLTDTQKEAIASMLDFVSENFLEFVTHCESTIWPKGSADELDAATEEIGELLKKA